MKKLRRRLANRFPTATRVVVRIGPVQDGSFGLTTVTAAGDLLIRIDERLPALCQEWMLLHEWAHALVWHTEPHGGLEHDAAWALAYRRLWSWYCGEMK